MVDTARPTLRAQTAALLRDAALEPPRTQVAAVFDYLRCGVPWFVAEAFVMRDYPTASRAANLFQPVLVLRGERDPIAREEWCARLASQM